MQSATTGDGQRTGAGDIQRAVAASPTKKPPSFGAVLVTLIAPPLKLVTPCIRKRTHGVVLRGDIDRAATDVGDTVTRATDRQASCQVDRATGHVQRTVGIRGGADPELVTELIVPAVMVTPCALATVPALKLGAAARFAVNVPPSTMSAPV